MNFPVYFYLGSLRLHPHIVLEAIAYMAALQITLYSRRYGDVISSTQRSSVVVGGMVGALIGAKLLVMLQHLPLLWLEGFQTWGLLLLQGKTVVGALLGGLIGVELTKKYIGVTTSTGDRFVYPLMVGTMIGRVGCFLTGLSDRTFGTATSLPWGIDFGDGIPRHPTQLYEIVFLAGLLIYLRWRDLRWRDRNLNPPPGERFRLFMVGYLGFRLLIDFIKPDFRLLGLSAIQIACILGLIYYRHSISTFFRTQ